MQILKFYYERIPKEEKNAHVKQHECARDVGWNSCKWGLVVGGGGRGREFCASDFIMDKD